MDFHCQYYRKRILLSFTGELFREGKKERFCSTPLPEIALCAPQNDAAETLRPQTRSRKAVRDAAQAPQKNQTTHVRTHIPETLHWLPRLSRTRRTQFCRLCALPTRPSACRQLRRRKTSSSGFISSASSSSRACPDVRAILLRLPPGVLPSAAPRAPRARSGQVRLHVRGSLRTRPGFSRTALPQPASALPPSL